jgi:hypothetical protein
LPAPQPVLDNPMAQAPSTDALIEAYWSDEIVLRFADSRRRLEQRNGVNPGDEANLVVLEASPVIDIRNTQQIALVIHHGVVMDRGKLLARELSD